MPELPFWKTINSSYAFVFYDLKRYFSTSWRLIAIAFGAVFFFAFVAELVGIKLLEVFGYLIIAGVWVSYVVGWHRAILLDEEAGRLVFGGREMRFLGFNILILLAIYLPFFLLLIPAFVFSEANPVILAIGSFLAITVLFTEIVLMGRFLLVLPAVAIENREMTFKKSWQTTAGNTWRIFGGIVVCLLPIEVVSGILSTFTEIAIEGDGVMLAAGFVMSILDLVLAFVEFALYAGFLSFAYRFFVEGAGATAQTTAA